MREYLQHYTEHAVPMRLNLAQLLIQREQRPALARRVLAKIPDDALAPRQRKLRRQLDQQADAMAEEGVLGLQEEDW